MAKTRKTTTNTAQKAQNSPEKPKSSWGQLATKLNGLVSQYGLENFVGAFGRAGGYWANQPQIQNARVKAISTLPADYTKEQLGEFLIAPYESERPLRQIGETLKYSNYSMFKIPKTYADMLTYRYFVQPKYVDETDVESKEFKREYALLDKFNKKLRPDELGHKVAMQCGTQGKVFYTLRYSVDKVHNKVDYAFGQQLPEDYCWIIGMNNISGYTISFDLTYFLTPGTDYRQFGDLFEPYMRDFAEVVTEDGEPNPKFIYAQKGKKYSVDRKRFNARGKEGNPTMSCQNGRWFYYVSLPIDRVWTFEIDDSSPVVVSPFTGLYQTFNQQADYEASQFALITLPLIKIFTGEIPYYGKNDPASTEDRFAMSEDMLQVFTTLFENLMLRNNTGGTAFYGAPFENIRAWDYSESAGANDTSKKFLEYGFSKSGLQSLVPVTDSPNMNVGQYSSKIESRFAQPIYACMERMINYVYESLNLNYTYQFVMFGDCLTEAEQRSNLMKALDKGDTTAYFMLAALDGMSMLDKVAQADYIKASGWLDKLSTPPTAYTQSGKSQSSGNTGTSAEGTPKKSETDVIETQIEKQTTTETE